MKQPWTNGQVERMNRTIKEASVKRYHYDSHDQLRQHLGDFVVAYNFGRRFKTLKGLAPYEAICKAWQHEPARFTSNPHHQMPGSSTCWLAPPQAKDAGIILDLPPGRSFDTVRLQEWLPLSIRVTRFAIDVWDGGDRWTTVAEKDMVGPQRLVRMAAPISIRRVRFRTVAAEAGPAIREFALFRSVAPVGLPPLKVTDASIVDRAGWKVTAASAPGAEAILDASPRTAWTSPAPASLTIDMGRSETLAGFTLTPTRHIDPQAAPPMKYGVETSTDSKRWTPGGEGEFQNFNYARATQRLPFPTARPARYLRFTFPQPTVPAPAIAVAEIGAFR